MVENKPGMPLAPLYAYMIGIPYALLKGPTIGSVTEDGMLPAIASRFSDLGRQQCLSRQGSLPLSRPATLFPPSTSLSSNPAKTSAASEQTHLHKISLPRRTMEPDRPSLHRSKNGHSFAQTARSQKTSPTPPTPPGGIQKDWRVGSIGLAGGCVGSMGMARRMNWSKSGAVKAVSPQTGL